MKKIKFWIFALALMLLSAQSLPVYALTYAEISGQSNQATGNGSAYLYPSASLVNDNTTIYFIRGTSKIPFTNYPAFIGLGYSQKNVDIGDLQNYTLVPDYVISTANAQHPWGSWLVYNQTVYYSTQQGLIPVPSWQTLLDNGGQSKFIVKANSYDATILNSSPSLPILQTADSRVYGATPPNYSFGTPPAAATTSPNGLQMPLDDTTSNSVNTSASSGIGSANTTLISPGTGSNGAASSQTAPFQLYSSAFPNGTVGQLYSQGIQYHYSGGESYLNGSYSVLPPGFNGEGGGISLTNSGLVSSGEILLKGLPTQSGNFTVNITITDDRGMNDVLALPITINNSTATSTN